MDQDIAGLRPRSQERVMDLVAQAGLDVSDWQNYAKGPSHAAANPRCCYNWSFVEAGTAVVLNLWWSNISSEGGRVVHRANYRREAQENRAAGLRSQWIARGFALDEALKTALRTDLPVRVIINDGRREDHADLDRRASSVANRKLDSRPWTIASYDWETGDCLLVRGHHGAIVKPE